MADISQLHPLIQKALRTGEVPNRQELAHLLGGKIPNLSDLADETVSDKNATEREHPDAEAFRARYHAMVEERISDWLDDHPQYGNAVPAAVRHRIEDDCDRQIQHQWATHRRRLAPHNDDQNY
ncbi:MULTISPECIES: hypothetical protein [Mycobacterium]|uniref:Uncharacterized protein n=1 Tax=Mycobacterium paragordonae TaxID=1389713 RepID=A0AAJ1W734_9MYCO|nr:MULTISPECIES: hypothetical protein [Mycobacterium]MDP7707663.1 hypothetical protein [Mycobacterium sp. TY815]MDP7733085.1 hypothetical protein [Mycobacterium sp. TY813]MDP7739758.1 hypothetical protein [Mycobacterium paragordonae]PJE00436.1 MAG: hypothetical protein CK428_32460 [Mycobacterium sp.]